MLEGRKLNNVNKKIDKLTNKVANEQQKAENNLRELDKFTKQYNDFLDEKEELENSMKIIARYGSRKDLNEASKAYLLGKIANFAAQRKANGLIKKTEKIGKEITKDEKKLEKLNTKKKNIQDKMSKRKNY